MTPTLTEDQRTTALEAALERRRAHRALLDDVAAGRVSPAAVIADPPTEAARTLRVYRLIRAVPGYGQVKADQLLNDTRIQARRRVGGLGPRQRDRLVKALTR